ncbi:hypothetical protein SPLC1_S271140 [Arthrospira platensis C1]|uniref:Uncharacterized protein n=1 Tax=Limnospira maxima CS-328 TaxID=513049 RepID=B5W9S2_LIMMA|nr:hypothetical protein AmaxDRAFT_5522 [Limnospira maxima CS-328]EKD08192.1 hypothetical protein SPLC1_S271140 [Arthrospira platensis C1]UWU46959.1 hypothetical protein APLC1_1695 [Arthrospira platensis C1]
MPANLLFMETGKINLILKSYSRLWSALKLALFHQKPGFKIVTIPANWQLANIHRN